MNLQDVLKDASSKQRKVFREAADRLLDVAHDANCTRSARYQAFIELGILGKALQALEAIELAESVIANKPPVRVDGSHQL